MTPHFTVKFSIIGDFARVLSFDILEISRIVTELITVSS